MRTDTAQPIRLKDYREPDWLVETVSLDFSLHPTQTKVRATLALKPNPAAAAAPLVLDGDGLTLAGLKLDGSRLPAESYVATPDSLTIPQVAERARSGWKSKRWSIRPPTRSSPGFIGRAAIIARNAKRKASAALLTFPTGPT